MKNQKVSPLVGTVILVIIAITVSAFVLAHKKNQLSQQAQNTELPTSQETEGRQITVGNEWDVFENKELGYAVKYPQGYTIKRYDPPCDSQPNSENGKNIIIQISDSKENGYESYAEKGKTTDYDIFINDPLDKCIRNAYSSISGPEEQKPKLLESENITVNGRPILKRSYVHLDPKGDSSVFHFSTWRFREKGMYYTLLFNNGVKITNPESQNDLFFKFISSFKFTEEKK